jgi:hypothetical protein
MQKEETELLKNNMKEGGQKEQGGSVGGMEWR